MTKSNPKMILNLNIENEEFENKVQVAVDHYIDDIVHSVASEKLNTAIKRYVDKKLDDILHERRFTNESLVEGKYLSQLIADAARPKIAEVITKAVADVVQGQFASLLTNQGGLK